MIKTKRLILKPLELNHAKGLYKLWTNENVIKYTYTVKKNDISQVEEFIKKRLENNTIVFTIFLQDEIVGITGSPTIDTENGEYGFFYQLLEESWGEGYGYEVATALLRYNFTETNAKTIRAQALPINMASVKILEKIGMEKKSITANGFDKDGLLSDLYNFEITVDQWRETNGKKVYF